MIGWRGRPGCFTVVLGGARDSLAGVSLNRSEQEIFNYIEANREERQFWEYKVREYAGKSVDTADVASRIDGELWRYYVERSAVVPRFKQQVQREGLRRVTMKNLAEYLLRMWVAPKPIKRSAQHE